MQIDVSTVQQHDLRVGRDRREHRDISAEVAVQQSASEDDVVCERVRTLHHERRIALNGYRARAVHGEIALSAVGHRVGGFLGRAFRDERSARVRLRKRGDERARAGLHELQVPRERHLRIGRRSFCDDHFERASLLGGVRHGERRRASCHASGQLDVSAVHVQHGPFVEEERELGEIGRHIPCARESGQHERGGGGREVRRADEVVFLNRGEKHLHRVRNALRPLSVVFMSPVAEVLPLSIDPLRVRGLACVLHIDTVLALVVLDHQ